MKKLIQILLFVVLISPIGGWRAFAQIGINATNTPPSPSAMLDVNSTTKGMLIPRMTSGQRTSITGTQGLMVFDTTTNSFWFHNGSIWIEIAANTSPWTPTNSNTNLFSSYNFFTLGGGTNIGALTSGAGADGTLRVFSPGSTINPSYLNLDALNIQARRQNQITGIKTEMDLKLNPFGGNVGIGLITPTAKLHVAGAMKIDGTNTLEFGAGLTKETNAGKIGYQTFTDGLEIVGAGSSVGTRKINLWAEGGTTLKGGLYASQTGNLNLVPLGVMEYRVTESNNGITSTSTFLNLTGNMVLSSTASSTVSIYDYLTGIFELNTAITANYTKIIAMNTLSWKSETAFASTFPLMANFSSSCTNSQFTVELNVDSFSLLSSGVLSGTVIFYGIK